MNRSLSAPAARRDWWLATVVALGVVLYLGSLPYNLGVADESFFLNDSKRLLHGQLMYRDVFYYATPGAHWLMAAVFWLFGTSMRVARLSMAVLHGAIAATVYVTCRRVHARPVFGLAAAIAGVALCQSAWPYASLHWLSAQLMVAILFVAVGRWTTGRVPAWSLGLLTGALVAVQQQKGIAMAVAAVALFALHAAVAWRTGAPAPVRTALRRTLWLAAGVAAVAVPLLAVLIAQVGVAPLVEQLVVFPFTGYREYNHATWGQVLPLAAQFAPYTLPTLLAALPAVAAIGVLRALWLWASHPESPQLTALLALLTLCGGATLSILYLPDFIHIALIAPVFLVFWAETLDAAVRWVPMSPARQRAFAWAVGGALLAGLSVQLARNATRMWRNFPITRETAFGRVDFATPGEAALVDQLRELLAQAGTREFFAYPMYTSLYLTTDSDNPTPFHMMLPGWNTPAQYAAVVQVLETHRLPYVFACAVQPDTPDPILHFLAEHYERVSAGTHPCGLYRRRDLTVPAPGS